MVDASDEQITLRAIAQLRTLTLSLLERAQAGDWDNVTLLERERKPLLQAVLGPEGPLPQAQREALLQAILGSDREVVRLAEARRDELGGLLRQTGQGRTVVKAYDSNSR